MPVHALPPLVPPFRFGIIEHDIYRGAYPTLKNVRFLHRLHLRTILTLSSEPITTDLKAFCEAENIQSIHYHAEKFEDTPTLSSAKVAKILRMLVNPAHHPLFVHCRDGGHATGHVIMCLRRLQNWNLSVIFSEFCRFVKGGEIRLAESQFVESFKAEVWMPSPLPAWLWGGQRIARHPCVRLKWDEPVRTANDGSAVECEREGDSIGGMVSKPSPQSGMRDRSMMVALDRTPKAKDLRTQNDEGQDVDGIRVDSPIRMQPLIKPVPRTRVEGWSERYLGDVDWEWRSRSRAIQESFFVGDVDWETHRCSSAFLRRGISVGSLLDGTDVAMGDKSAAKVDKATQARSVRSLPRIIDALALEHTQMRRC